MSDQYNSKLYKLFYASYTLIHFDLFPQLNSFLFHPFFRSKFLNHAFFRHDYIFSDTLWYFLITPKKFSLNIYSYSWPHSVETIERPHVFLKKIYGIFVFLDFLYLLQIWQYFLTYLDSVENILISFCHSFYIN